MKYYNLDPLPIVSGDPAELFFDDREDCEFARTLAARTSAIISQVRRYTVTRYTYPGRLAGDFLPYRPDHRRYGAILSHRL